MTDRNILKVSPEERIKIQRKESKIMHDAFDLPDDMNPIDEIC